MPGAHLHPIDLPPADLALKLPQQTLPGGFGERLGHAEADRVLGRGLGDERDGDLAGMQRGESAGRDTGHAEHAVAGHSDQGLSSSGRQRLDRETARGDSLGDLGSLRGGIGKGPDVDRDAPAAKGNQGSGVKHLGTVVGQLRSLPRVQLGNHSRIRHDPRVSGEQPGHILPERDLERRRVHAPAA